jgi:hypothetical protein
MRNPNWQLILKGAVDAVSLPAQLEAIIDAAGMAEVLFVLAAIANEKAEHLATNWQDDAAATKWLNVSTRIENVARIAKRDLP